VSFENEKRDIVAEPKSIPYETPDQTRIGPMASAREGTLDYEKQLDQNLRWALNQGSLHFEENSAVFKALRKITATLNELDIPYAVVDGMALFRHGLRRFTEDVGILVTSSALATIHEKLEGRGYRPPFARSKNLRDTELGVRIEFLIAGEYPGDGKPKPVSFPDPQLVSVDFGGVHYIRLSKLVELKLASGMTEPTTRIKDLADVVELIKVLQLPLELAEQLDPSVRERYVEYWNQLANSNSGSLSSDGADKE
jgi:hypothetical protein